MELRYGTLADYAGVGAGGKQVLVGIFNTVFATTAQRPVSVPLCYLAAFFEAHVTEGTEHQLTVRLQTEDGRDLMPTTQLPLRFGAQGPGRPLVAFLAIALIGLQVPELGTYAFQLLVDNNRHVGTVPFYVQQQVIG